jgi:hypothetical protein
MRHIPTMGSSVDETLISDAESLLPCHACRCSLGFSGAVPVHWATAVAVRIVPASSRLKVVIILLNVISDPSPSNFLATCEPHPAAIAQPAQCRAGKDSVKKG